MGSTDNTIVTDVSELDPDQVSLAAKLCTGIVAALASAHPTTAPAPAVRVHGWDEDMARELVARLQNHGGLRDHVMRAIVDAGGSIDRETVMSVCGFGPMRNMTGFTKPVKGVLRDFVMRGDITAQCEEDAHPANPMRPYYANGPGKFTDLFMAPELATLFQRALTSD